MKINNFRSFQILLTFLVAIIASIVSSELSTNATEVNKNSENNSMSQITSVSQLSDVQPTDWAFQSLQSLVERYGCIEGYPDRTFRGNRALTRYEFAAGLNACLDRIQELIAASTPSFVSKEDLASLQRLQENFAAELATIRGRIDALETRTTQLEANQFSTTTKLKGEAIFAVTDVLSGDNVRVNLPAAPFNPITGAPQSSREFITPRQNTVFVNRVRLNFLTSFTGQDELKIRLESGNSAHPGRRAPDNIQGFEYGANPITGYVSVGNQAGVARTVEGQQTFQDIGRLSPNNSVGITSLSYEFPIGSRLRAVVMAAGGEHFDYVPTTFSSWDDDNGGTGSLSIFAQRSPIYSIMGPGAGVGFTYSFNNQLSFSAGYLASEASNPTQGNGLFNGRYSALAQLTFQPTDNLSFGLIYNRAYLPGGNIFNNDLGTSLGNNPTFPPTGYRTNSYGISGLWRVTPRFAINSWVAYTDVEGFPGVIAPGTPFEARVNRTNANVLTYAVALAFPDLGRKGNLGGLVFGASPYVTRSRIPSPFSEPQTVPGNRAGFGTTDLLQRIPDRATPFHVEAFYVYRITENILLTPGVIWLTAPNQTNRNPDVFIGTLRATFLF